MIPWNSYFGGLIFEEKTLTNFNIFIFLESYRFSARKWYSRRKL